VFLLAKWCFGGLGYQGNQTTQFQGNGGKATKHHFHATVCIFGLGTPGLQKTIASKLALLRRSEHSDLQSWAQYRCQYTLSIPPPAAIHYPAVFKDAFCFFLVPPSPGGSRGRVRTVVFLQTPVFWPGFGGVILILIFILTLRTAGK
jgi:hypothetical protein